LESRATASRGRGLQWVLLLLLLSKVRHLLLHCPSNAGAFEGETLRLPTASHVGLII
jgi:hypothetical protein